MNPLGKGLHSLIPEKKESPPEIPTLDVLAAQSSITEPVYRFRSDSEAIMETADAVSAPLAMPAVVRDVPDYVAPRPREAQSVFFIDVRKIEPNPHQPRREFNMDELLALASSIRQHGILQPLLVTKREIELSSGLDVRYELIAGERRWRAAKLAGLREVPVMIRTADVSDRDKLEMALIENVQREDLNPLERARAFERLIGDFGLMQTEVADRVGKSREVVANSLRLLRLPQEIRDAVGANLLTEGHARAILMLDGRPDEQLRLFTEIRGANLSVRDTMFAARATGNVRTRRRRTSAAIDPDLRDIQRRLEEAFGTRVSLLKRGDQGKIVVEFYSQEELQGILERIAGRGGGYI